MDNTLQTIMSDIGNLAENVIDAFSNNNTKYFSVDTTSQTKQEQQELDALIDKQIIAGVVIREYSNPLTLGIIETSNCLSQVYADKNRYSIEDIQKACDDVLENYSLKLGVK